MGRDPRPPLVVCTTTSHHVSMPTSLRAYMRTMRQSRAMTPCAGADTVTCRVCTESTSERDQTTPSSTTDACNGCQQVRVVPCADDPRLEQCVHLSIARVHSYGGAYVHTYAPLCSHVLAYARKDAHPVLYQTCTRMGTVVR